MRDGLGVIQRSSLLIGKIADCVDVAGACTFPTLGQVNFTISVAVKKNKKKVHNLKDVVL